MVVAAAAVGRFAAWRSVWLQPEAYPIVGAVSVALAGACYFGYHKLVHDPTVVTSRSLRNAGFQAQFDARPQDIGHMTGLAHISKQWSTRVFDKQEANPIRLYNTSYLEIEKKRLARYNGTAAQE
mmetsp:Transcript_7671/g.20333  ORF Transcript_7671/g.20333 Transcript_7671/m.20333 type:complete len:125 (+) Transcript_7671:243-617(+)|eukprot:CAMPEP_0185834510 /NCGR_PEP_ID=MMETSP1353-20130828/5475_1 /TAXON_ID=1077150 /ORGANISM="Erythrolobus australicus, Strain CCMP3124" /LENGTH=124 /DNA_ID=CAMNT_0028532953 /DNA_START=191 /DNA_END=565 /DNA_ORIENTATION=+